MSSGDETAAAFLYEVTARTQAAPPAVVFTAATVPRRAASRVVRTCKLKSAVGRAEEEKEGKEDTAEGGQLQDKLERSLAEGKGWAKDLAVAINGRGRAQAAGSVMSAFLSQKCAAECSLLVGPQGRCVLTTCHWIESA
jgi:hypothetical protein